MSSEPLLKTIDLTRTVSTDNGPRTIVDCISSEFHTAKVYSILGPSGAGKSSLLRLLNRLDEPTGGEVIFEGSDYRTMQPGKVRCSIGYLFQVPYLFPGTMADNVRYARPGLEDRQICELLTLATIQPDRCHEPVDKLSVGEKQRVALARLLATNPRVILLDEPTSALDPTYTEKIEESIKKVVQVRSSCVIMVSHNPEQALRMGGECLLLVNGKVAETGSVEQIVNDPQTELGRRYKNRELS